MAIASIKKLLFIIFLLCIKIACVAQEKVFNSTNLGEKLSAVDTGFNFESIDKTILLSFIDENGIVVHTNTNNFDNPNTHIIKKNTIEYENFIGSYGTSQDIIYVYAKNSKKKFLTLKYNFATKKTKETNLEFKLKNQFYLGHFNYKDNFYIISILKNTRIFKLTKIDVDSKFSDIDIDVQKGDFIVDGILKKAMPSYTPSSSSEDRLIDFGSTYPITEMKEYLPNTNEEVTNANKFYVNDGKLIITLDSNGGYTTMISIDLDSYLVITQIISKKVDIALDYKKSKSNSFFYKNILYQINGDKNNMTLSAFDLKQNSGNQIIQFDRKTPYNAKKNLIISNKILRDHNLVITQNEKELDVQKRLKKIMKFGNKLGFQVTENPNVLLFNIGGYGQSSGTIHSPIGGIGGGVAVGLSFNYTFTRDESLNFFIDKNDNSLTYSNFENPYDRMKTYLDELYEDKTNKKTKWVHKFKMDTDYYLGYLDKKSKEYRFVKFN